MFLKLVILLLAACGSCTAMHTILPEEDDSETGKVHLILFLIELNFILDTFKEML